MTGRGLTVVAAVAESWGGKVVWAVIRPGTSEHVEQPEIDLDALLAAWDDDSAEPEFPVRLGSVPTSLLLDAKQHIDNVVRELTLLGASESAPAELDVVIETITVEFAR